MKNKILGKVIAVGIIALTFVVSCISVALAGVVVKVIVELFMFGFNAV